MNGRLLGTTLFQHLTRILAASLAVLLCFLLVFNIVGMPRAFDWSMSRLYSVLAAEVANWIQPYLLADLDLRSVERELASAQEVNPALEFYLLRADGSALLSVPPRDIGAPIDLHQVDGLFAMGHSRATVYGTHPRTGESAVVSIAPLKLGRARGYLYVVIGDRLLNVLRQPGALTRFSVMLLPTFLAVAALGSLFLASFVRFIRIQFGALRRTCEKLLEGDYAERAMVASNDDIGFLAESFNSMAAAIVGKEEIARRTEEARRRLVATALHDLRAPITAMQGYLEILEDSVPRGKQNARGRAESLLAASRRQAAFLSDLEQIVELDTAQERLSIEEVPLLRVAEESVELHAPAAARKNITVVLEPFEGRQSIAGDRFRIERAFSNLLGNAIAYTPAGGEVRLKLTPSHGGISVAFVDTGVGIAEEEQPFIFHDFYRASSSGKTQGSGLGLGIVRRIAAAHGGQVRLESTVGRGTTFFLELPWEPRKSDPVPAPTSFGSENDAAPLKTLFDRPAVIETSFIVLLCSLMSFDRRIWAIVYAAGCLILQAMLRRLSETRSDTFVLALQPLPACLPFLLLGADLSRTIRIASLAALSVFAIITFYTRGRNVRQRLVASAIPLLTVAVHPPFSGNWEVPLLTVFCVSMMGWLAIAAFRGRGGNRFAVRFAVTLGVLSGLSTVLLFSDSLLLWNRILRESDREVAPYLEEQIRRTLGDASKVPYSPDYVHELLAKVTILRPDLNGILSLGGHRYVALGLEPVQVRPDWDRPAWPEQYCRTFWAGPVASIPFGVPAATCRTISFPMFGESVTLTYWLLSTRFATLLKEAQQEASWIGGLSAVLFIGTSVFAFWFRIERTISRRLQRMVVAMRTVRAGDLSVQVPVDLHDDLGLVGEAMNQLINILASRQQRIVNADRRLRELVQQLVCSLRPVNKLVLDRTPQILELDSAAGDVGASLMSELRSAIRAQRELIEELFLVTKLDLGEVTLRCMPCGVEEIVTELIELRPHLRGVREIRWRLPEDPPTIFADPELVRRVVRILAEEVATPALSFLSCEIETVFRSVRVTLSCDWIESERWASVQSGSDRDSLRLALARRLVDLQHGEMKAVRDEEGRLAGVSLAFPHADNP